MLRQLQNYGGCVHIKDIFGSFLVEKNCRNENKR